MGTCTSTTATGGDATRSPQTLHQTPSSSNIVRHSSSPRWGSGVVVDRDRPPLRATGKPSMSMSFGRAMTEKDNSTGQPSGDYGPNVHNPLTAHGVHSPNHPNMAEFPLPITAMSLPKLGSGRAVVDPASNSASDCMERNSGNVPLQNSGQNNTSNCAIQTQQHSNMSVREQEHLSLRGGGGGQAVQPGTTTTTNAQQQMLAQQHLHSQSYQNDSSHQQLLAPLPPLSESTRKGAMPSASPSTSMGCLHSPGGARVTHSVIGNNFAEMRRAQIAVVQRALQRQELDTSQHDAMMPVLRRSPSTVNHSSSGVQVRRTSNSRSRNTELLHSSMSLMDRCASPGRSMMSLQAASSNQVSASQAALGLSQQDSMPYAGISLRQQQSNTTELVDVPPMGSIRGGGDRARQASSSSSSSSFTTNGEQRELDIVRAVAKFFGFAAQRGERPSTGALMPHDVVRVCLWQADLVAPSLEEGSCMNHWAPLSDDVDVAKQEY